MIVVSDTSPLSYLHRIERLSILKSLYGAVVIPPAVRQEIQAAGRLHEQLDWSFIRIIAPVDTKEVDELREHLDRGESEAIVVARELKADLLLIDERSGREIAKAMGVPRIGLLGVLLEAKSRGLIRSVAQELGRLEAATNFRLHPTVRAEVLRLANEQ